MERVVLLALLLAAALAAPEQRRSITAPTPSRCEMSGDTALCSGLGLSAIPENFPVSLKAVDLSHNNISSIESGDFARLSHLETLNLTFNRISLIAPTAFFGCPALRVVDLSHNRLPDAWDNAFLGLGSVESLDVTNNLYAHVQLPGEFASLSSLRRLVIGGANVTDIARSRSNALWPPLQELSLHTGDLVTYAPGSLTTPGGLRTALLKLELRAGVRFLHSVVCDLAKCTAELRVALVDFREHGDSTDVFACVSAPSSVVETFVMSQVELTDKYISFLLHNMVFSQSLVQVRLENIGFDSVGIWNAPLLPSPHGSLRNFHIDGIVNPNFFGFSTLQNIEVLLSKLELLSVTHADLFYLPCNVMRHCTNVRSLDLTGNLLTEHRAFAQCPSLELPSLTDITLRKNFVSSVRGVCGTLEHTPNVTLADASDNQLRGGEAPLGCQWPVGLRVLNFSFNFLTDDVFRSLPASLRALDVSNNKIKAVGRELLSFENLDELRLSGNHINSVPEKVLRAMPWLKVLVLADNALTTVDPSALRVLGGLTSLDMRGNPFYCSCDVRAFVAFGGAGAGGSNVSKMTGWPAGYKCSNPADAVGKDLASLSFSVLYCDTTLKAAVCSTVAAVCTAALSWLCWYLDVAWYVRMTWAWLRAKRRASRDADDDGEGDYDAFVSYSQRDIAWVRDELLPHLEERRPGQTSLRLCVHERDFTPGRFIIDNIVEAIERSRRTLFVISRSFVESEWCHYELYFAQQRLLDSRRDRLVLVLLEPVPRDSVPSRYCRLRRIMARRTYLEWPQERARQALFWANLRACLGGRGAQVAGGDAAATAAAAATVPAAHEPDVSLAVRRTMANKAAAVV